MNIYSAIAIYFIIWWLMLFIALPFGVRNSHEAGELVEEGNEPGAPVCPLLMQKALVTSLLAAAVFAGVLLLYGGNIVTLDDLWFIGPSSP
jgi:predicted secreted protein